MGTTVDYRADRDLLGSRWDLTALVDADESAVIERLLDDAASRALGLAKALTGRVAELDAAGLIRAMRELPAMKDLTGRTSSYAELRLSVSSTDPDAGALAQRVQERTAEIESKLLFFEVFW